MLSKWKTDLVKVFGNWPSIRTLCQYHFILRVFIYHTLYGGSRHHRQRFPLIFDHNFSYLTARLRRQVETTTRRLNIVSNLLLPIDARTKIILGGGDFVGEKDEKATIFEPLVLLKKFINARNDLMFLQAMLTKP